MPLPLKGGREVGLTSRGPRVGAPVGTALPSPGGGFGRPLGQGRRGALGASSPASNTLLCFPPPCPLPLLFCLEAAKAAGAPPACRCSPTASRPPPPTSRRLATSMSQVGPPRPTLRPALSSQGSALPLRVPAGSQVSPPPKFRHSSQISKWGCMSPGFRVWGPPQRPHKRRCYCPPGHGLREGAVQAGGGPLVSLATHPVCPLTRGWPGAA